MGLIEGTINRSFDNIRFILDPVERKGVAGASSTSLEKPGPSDVSLSPIAHLLAESRTYHVRRYITDLI
jgi:hypothetical protein